MQREWLWHVLGVSLILGAAVIAYAGNPVSRYLAEPIVLESPSGYSPTLIEPAALKAAMRHPGDVVVVDVRPKEMYAMGHLPGAIDIPGYDLQNQLDKVPEGVKLALYCS